MLNNSQPVKLQMGDMDWNHKILKEFTGFAGSRLSTWILDIVIMWLTVNIFSMNYWIAKICISSVLVTILNYVFSKILIFKKK